MENRYDENEEREDRRVPPTYLSELLPQNPTFGLSWFVPWSDWSFNLDEVYRWGVTGNFLQI